MKTNIQTNMLGQPVIVTKRSWAGHNSCEQVIETWKGIVRNVYLDSDGAVLYTVQGILVNEDASRRGHLSDHYGHDITIED